MKSYTKYNKSKKGKKYRKKTKLALPQSSSVRMIASTNCTNNSTGITGPRFRQNAAGQFSAAEHPGRKPIYTAVWLSPLSCRCFVED